MSIDVLIIDDEEDIRDLISDILQEEGCDVRTASDSESTFMQLEKKVPTAIILDIWLQGSDLDGLGILEQIRKKYPILPVVVISGHGTIATAVSAIKLGAFDYVEKPFTQEKLLIALKRSWEAAKLKKENLQLKSKILDKAEFIGESKKITNLKLSINKISKTDKKFIIEGPIGTGKKLVARLVHRQSKRGMGPFIAYTPVGKETSTINKELFGMVDKNSKDQQMQLSAIERANRGTLYIDEVLSLPSSTQVLLYKFLKDQTLINKNKKKIKLDVRLVVGSSIKISEEVREKRFNQELYSEIKAFNVYVNSLSERKEDIPALIEHFVKEFSRSSSLKIVKFSQDALAVLQTYAWPLNVRQLKNLVERVMIQNSIFLEQSNKDVASKNNMITLIKSAMLPHEILGHKIAISKNDGADFMSMPLKDARFAFEKQYLIAQVKRYSYNISQTANFIGMERSALHRKLRLLGLSLSSLEEDKGL